MLSSVGKLNSEFTNPTTSVPYGNGRMSVYLVFIYALLFTTTLPYMSVRFLSIKKDLKVHTMALIAAPMGIILSLVPLVGIYMYYKNPNMANPDSAMPVFLNTFLSPALAGIISLFILFAMLSTISSVLQALASALSYDMFVSVANRNSKHGDLFNRLGVLFIGVWGMFLTFMAPQGLLNQIAYIGTGGLISSFVGPIIMRAFVKADIRTCLASMLTGFFLNAIFVFKLNLGWVEAPILAGLAGAVVYLIMGYITNGWVRLPKEQETSEVLS